MTSKEELAALRTEQVDEKFALPLSGQRELDRVNMRE